MVRKSSMKVISTYDKDHIAQFEVMGRCLVIRLQRDLDHHNALVIREKSDRLIEKKNIKNIIFDFESSNFMDSSGIGVIMGRYKQVTFTGGKVAVTNMNNSIDRIFRLSGLFKIIRRYQTVNEALEDLNEI